MFHTVSNIAPTLPWHHATMRERVIASRYTNHDGAIRLLLEHTDLPRYGCLIEKAALVVMGEALGIKEGRRDSEFESLSEDILFTGETVEMHLAMTAVDCINEQLFEAIVS